MRHRSDDPELAGIADQPVEVTPAIKDHASQPVDAVTLAQIERHKRAGPARLLDRVVEVFESADGAGDGDHMRAAARCLERCLIANAAARPGDEDDLAGEVSHGVSSPRASARPSWDRRYAGPGGRSASSGSRR